MSRPDLLPHGLGLLMLVIFVGSVSPSIAVAADIHVPAQQPTIQAAITAAQAGDTVVVAPGTYFENLNFLGRAITVRSDQGPAVTIIDGGQAGTVVSFVTAEGPDSILMGFTIQNGLPMAFTANDGGGGISCLGSSPVIRENVIRQNHAHWAGAGIYSLGGSPMIIANEVVENGFFCLIADAPCGTGGGIYTSGGSPQIVNNLICQNSAPDAGGGLYVTASDPQGVLIEGNRFEDNFAGDGGGVAITSSTALLWNNLVANNTAAGYATLLGLIPGAGGGLWTSGSSVTINGSTIAGNQALDPQGSGLGGGVHVDTGMVTIGHGIVWGNQAGTASQLSNVPSVTQSIVQGGAPGSGNLDLDPLFVSGPLGDHYLSQVAAGQLQDSPAVDAGNPLTPAPLGTTRTDAIGDQGVRDLGYHYPVTGGNHVRGDCNADGATNIADVIALLTMLYPVQTPMLTQCTDACDGNDDGSFNIADAVAILGSLFGMPTQALPAPSACGPDPTPDLLDCQQFGPCP